MNDDRKNNKKECELVYAEKKDETRKLIALKKSIMKWLFGSFGAPDLCHCMPIPIWETILMMQFRE